MGMPKSLCESQQYKQIQTGSKPQSVPAVCSVSVCVRGSCVWNCASLAWNKGVFIALLSCHSPPLRLINWRPCYSTQRRGKRRHRKNPPAAHHLSTSCHCSPGNNICTGRHTSVLGGPPASQQPHTTSVAAGTDMTNFKSLPSVSEDNTQSAGEKEYLQKRTTGGREERMEKKGGKSKGNTRVEKRKGGHQRGREKEKKKNEKKKDRWEERKAKDEKKTKKMGTK